MLYRIIQNEKYENKYDLNDLIFWQKKSIDLNREWFKLHWFKSANPDAQTFAAAAAAAKTNARF